jgi:hypothetical protein
MHGKYSSTGRRPTSVATTVLVATLLLAPFCLVSSCSRKAQSAAQSPRPIAAPSPTNAPAAAQAAGQPAATPPKPEAPLAASIRAFGLGAPSTPRFARDFSLGPLQPYAPAKGDETDIFEVARAFMDGIAAGKLDPELLLPEAREALSVLLAPSQAEAQPKAPYRLGAISVSGEDASLRVRLPSALSPDDPKAVLEEGLLSLRKVDDAWYVEALALDAPRSGPLAFDSDPRTRDAPK